MEVNAGGVIAYISSSSSASSPASCHSESSESSFQSSSSPVPSSPNSSTSESSCNSRSSEGSDGAPKNDQLDDAVKTSRSSAAGLTKGHGGLTNSGSYGAHPLAKMLSKQPLARQKPQLQPESAIFPIFFQPYSLSSSSSPLLCA